MAAKFGRADSKSNERLAKWSRGHYLLKVFKTSVAIILKNIKFIECGDQFSR